LAYSNRGHAYSEKEKHKLAIADFNKVIELTDDPILIDLAKGYIRVLQMKLATGG